MKRKFAFVVMLLLLLAAFLLTTFSRKRSIRPNTVGVLESGVSVKSTNGFAAGFVVITNSTGKHVFLEMVAIRAKPSTSSSNFSETVIFGEIPSRIVLGPHSTNRWRLVFPSAPPSAPWVFRFRVGEEVKGMERGVLIAGYLMRHFRELSRGKAVVTSLVTINGTSYYRHENEIAVSKM